MTAALCRLCAEETTDTVNIFSGRGAELGLAEKISKCLPVVVSSAIVRCPYLKQRLLLQNGRYSHSPCS